MVSGSSLTGRSSSNGKPHILDKLFSRLTWFFRSRFQQPFIDPNIPAKILTNRHKFPKRLYKTINSLPRLNIRCHLSQQLVFWDILLIYILKLPKTFNSRFQIAEKRPDSLRLLFNPFKHLPITPTPKIGLLAQLIDNFPALSLSINPNPGSQFSLRKERPHSIRNPLLLIQRRKCENRR